MKWFSKTPIVVTLVALSLVLGTALAVDAQQATFRLAKLGATGPGAAELTAETLGKGNKIIVVWASWSPRCRDIDKRVAALHEAWGSRADVLTVNFQEKPAAIRDALSKMDMKVPVYVDADGRFSKAHAVTTVPHVIVYSNGKRVVAQRLTRDVDSIIDANLN